ncbi:MAG TPA: TylF/MycF/NovP-related O-methyltransferase [Candidatus Dormibacteraeota bacterium]|nr:TylF/MycF/NovP-related O-methyltransferase [Candidatus Dormibacteraeota bacterium]
MVRREPAPPTARPGLEALTPEDRRIVERAMPHTMTSVARIQAVIDAVRYCDERGIHGAFAECGVWRGGSVLAMILTLQELRAEPRHIYLYDTFEGMTEPGNEDGTALRSWRDSRDGDGRAWPEFFGAGVFSEEGVRRTLLATGYPADRLHFVRGPVEETIPAHGPGQLALLRLDTDWYESTRHELQHLYPLLADGAVLIIDDYGHWEGARRAVDEYFGTQARALLLNRIDYTGRVAIKH